MLKDVFDVVVQVLTLTRDNQQHKNDICKLQDEIKSIRADNAEMESTIHDMSLAFSSSHFRSNVLPSTTRTSEKSWPFD